MKKWLQNIFQDRNKKKITENFFSLSFLQGANYLLALITLPYLVRILGAEKFGLVMFAQAFIWHFVVFTDFGFNLTATRAISLARQDKNHLARIYSSVMLIKIGLTVLSLVIMTIIVFGFERFRPDWLLYYLTFGIVIGQVLFPLWFFQGIEKMKYQTAINLSAKLLFTLLIFIFITRPSDYIYVPLLNSLGYMTGGIIAVGTVLLRFKVRFHLPHVSTIKAQFREGWYVFISQISISLYTTTNTLILGLVTTNTVVGYYTSVEKIIQAIKFMPNPLYQAIYPHCAMLAETARQKAIEFIRKINRFTLIFALLGWIVIFAAARPIVVVILGNEYLPAIPIFRIFTFLVIITPLSYLVFNVALLSFKLDKYFSAIYVSGAVTNFLFLILFLVIFHLGANGVALSNVLAQATILSLGYLTLYKRNINMLYAPEMP
jgi:PST family polysaccharide transporter